MSPASEELFDVHKVRPDGTMKFYSGDRTQGEAQALKAQLEARGFVVKIVPAVRVEEDQEPSVFDTNSPRCPTCGSANLSRFSVVKKVGRVALFGPLGLRNVTKQFRCENCGYRW